jgi:hypothetical protein
LVRENADDDEVWEIFHDFRSLGEAQEDCVYFSLRLAKKEKKIGLFLLPSCHDERLLDTRPAFGLGHTNVVTSVLQESAILLAERGFLHNETNPHFVPSNLLTLANSAVALFACESNQLCALWRPRVDLLVVSYTRSKKKGTFRTLSSSSNNLRPSQCHFSILGRVSRWGNDDDDDDDDSKRRRRRQTVVCLYGGNKYVCLLKPEFSEGLLDRLSSDKPAGDVSPQDVQLREKKSRAPRRKPTAEQEKAAAEKKRQKAKREAKKIKEKLCHCSICSGKSFDGNMDRSGPEKLYKTDLMLRQILQVLGELTPDNEAIIDQMCRLSMASMDIESRTVQVDLRHPEVFTVLTEKNDGPSLMGCQAHVKKIQKPIMIAHQDELTEGVIHFTAENDSEEAIYSMMSKYWTQVMACQMECQEKKRQLAKPLFELAQKYQNSLLQLGEDFLQRQVLQQQQPTDSPTTSCETTAAAAADNDGQEEANRAKLKLFFEEQHLANFWKKSLPGRLFDRISRLVEEYHVFSFYGCV